MRFEGRNEKRVAMAIPVCMVTVGELLVADQAMTVNVSPHGARVVTRRRWQPEERPRLALSTGDLRPPSRVVYCEPLSNGNFCIGLRFPYAIEDWKAV